MGLFLFIFLSLQHGFWQFAGHFFLSLQQGLVQLAGHLPSFLQQGLSQFAGHLPSFLQHGFVHFAEHAFDVLHMPQHLPEFWLHARPPAARPVTNTNPNTTRVNAFIL